MRAAVYPGVVVLLSAALAGLAPDLRDALELALLRTPADD